jgi:hypothetical protein
MGLLQPVEREGTDGLFLFKLAGTNARVMHHMTIH